MVSGFLYSRGSIVNCSVFADSVNVTLGRIHKNEQLLDLALTGLLLESSQL